MPVSATAVLHADEAGRDAEAGVASAGHRRYPEGGPGCAGEAASHGQAHLRAVARRAQWAHPPGHAQVDFGEAVAIVGRVRQKIYFFCMDVPQSDVCFVNANGFMLRKLRRTSTT